MDGLEEKFRVYNEDPLADALRERLDKLAKKDIRWAPEILHLLLELSNKPVAYSKLGDLDLLEESEPEVQPRLRWDDLIREDPSLQGQDLWKNVDFGAESSDDGFEDSQSDNSGLTDSTVLSSVNEEFNRAPDEYIVDNLDKDGLEQLRVAQFWKKSLRVNGVELQSIRKPITELQAIREVVFMLFGFPTSLFEVDEARPAAIIPSKSYALKHASHDALDELLQGLAIKGSAVMGLRIWVKRRQTVPLLQVVHSSIGYCVLNLDMRLSDIQQRFAPLTEDVVVSILGVQAELDSLLKPLIRLFDITESLDQDKYAYPFRYLEMLYDETCVSQMAGDDDMYCFWGKLFFDCFQVYLRPLRNWMENGELTKDDKVFFISEMPGKIELASLWNSRFKIRKTQHGLLHAPRFLQAVAHKIFTTGKSVVVLKHLNHHKTLPTLRGDIDPTLNFQRVCNRHSLPFAPFPELFDVAFDEWVKSKHHYTSSILRKILFDSCEPPRLTRCTHPYLPA